MTEALQRRRARPASKSTIQYQIGLRRPYSAVQGLSGGLVGVARVGLGGFS